MTKTESWGICFPLDEFQAMTPTGRTQLLDALAPFGAHLSLPRWPSPAMSSGDVGDVCIAVTTADQAAAVKRVLLSFGLSRATLHRLDETASE